MIQFCDVLSEVVKFIVYSAAGFLFGCVFCRILRKVEKIEETVVDEAHIKTDDYEGPDRRAEDRREPLATSSKADRQGRIIGIFVIVLSLFTVGQSVYFSRESTQNTEHDKAVVTCQARFNDDFAKTLTIRSQYQEEDRLAMYRMITAIMGGGTPEERQKAIVDWIENSKKTDVLRKKNPIPNLDERNCGEVN